MEESRGRYLTRSSMLFVIVAFVVVGSSWGENVEACTPSSCGNIRNIRFPFRLNNDTKHCLRESKIILHCENNLTIYNLESGRYYVQEINYGNRTIRVVDPGIQKNNCSSIPRYYEAMYDFYNFGPQLNVPVTFFKCANPVNSSVCVDTAPCIAAASVFQPKTYGYVTIDYTSVSEIGIGCRVEWSTPMAYSQYRVFKEDKNVSYKHIHNALTYGFEISYRYEDNLPPADSPRDPSSPADSADSSLYASIPIDSPRCRGYIDSECVPYTIAGGGASSTTKLVAAAGSASLVLLLLIIAVYKFYTYDRNERENRLKIETFLEDYQALKPSRYSYEDIKRITNQFKERLGQGSYGTVFKGKLSSKLFVAVKVLKISNGNGEEFINEVGTLGHIHHVNVVRLVGFCSDGSRRALVYEFLPNGSLHDYISSEDNHNSFLGWDKMQSIALGIAKGIEYLHQGCDQRIMHFDIKPHNVMLDQNYTPKISDFGLAKLCSKDQSIVSMTTARGTMGYIAPEVFSRNFGNVSYKSDVYSFGMVLLEMVGGRRDIGATTENTNEVYHPELIYNLLERGEGPRIHIVEEGDAKIQRKLAIIGLWCIQWHPVDRPSMKVVVQMLEGEENLTIPPNPFGSTSDPARALHLQLETIVELA